MDAEPPLLFSTRRVGQSRSWYLGIALLVTLSSFEEGDGFPESLPQF